jgi:ABC-type transport system substrate-binding protein
MIRFFGIALCLLAFTNVMPLFAFELRYPISSKNIAINPTADLSSDSMVIRNQIFEGLVRIGNDYSIEPSLAASWSISLDGRKYVFKIKEKSFWHDGSPVLTSQICDYFITLIASNKKRHWLFSGLKGISLKTTHSGLSKLGIQCVDQSVVFDFEVPNSQFLSLMASAGARVGKKSEGKWIGTGPFCLSSQNTEAVILENSKYWLNSRKFANRILFENFENKVDLTPLILSKKFDLFPLSSNEVVQKMDQKEYLLSPAGSFHVRLLLFNNKARNTNNVNLRKAIAIGLNRNEIADKSGALNPAIATSLNPVELLRPKFVDFIPKYDKNLAINSIEKYGYKGTEVEFIHSLSGQGKSLATPNLIMTALKDIGLKVKEKKLAYEDYLNRINLGDFEIALINFQPDYPSIDAFYYPLLFSNAADNFVGFSNSDFDSLNTFARQEKDVEKVPFYYDKLNKILQSEVPLVPLYRSQSFVAHRKNLLVPINELGIGFLDFSKIVLSAE